MKRIYLQNMMASFAITVPRSEYVGRRFTRFKNGGIVSRFVLMTVPLEASQQTRSADVFLVEI